MNNCILVHDDLDLPVGTVRVRMRGGDGGHRGVQSIVQAFQDDKFRRIKIGVGRPPPGSPVLDYVLTPFSSVQIETIIGAYETAIDRIRDLIRQEAIARSLIVKGGPARRYVQIGQQALAVADCVVFVGRWASAALRAKRDPKDEMRAFASLRDASTYLSGYLMPGDLVLLKGSHKADHMQRLIVALTTDVQCWQSDCGRQQSCDTCNLLHVPSGPSATEAVATSLPIDVESIPVATHSSGADRSTVVVIGLGNPEAGRVNTPHNVGYEAVDILAQRLAQDWVAEGDMAMVVRGELQGVPVVLIKPLTPMNDIGPALVRLARDFSFDVHQCILVHDDLALPIGAVRARIRGSDGGHRGVRSILQAFQDDKFRRVKIGVGQPKEGQSVIDYVLTPFPAEQHAAVAGANQTAADRIVELIRQ